MKGTRLNHSQFQLLELSKVADRQCSIDLNMRGLGKDVVLMRSLLTFVFVG